MALAFAPPIFAVTIPDGVKDQVISFYASPVVAYNISKCQPEGNIIFNFQFINV